MYTRYLERYYFLMTLTDCKSNYLQGDNSEFKINRHFFFYWKTSLIARLILITCTLKLKTTCLKIIILTFYKSAKLFLQLVLITH